MLRDRGRPARRSTLLRGLFAFGLVLGVGAAVTDAQWTDVEYGTGTFVAGSFALQSSTDGTTFTDHPSGSAATLSFTATAMYPGLTVAAPFAVRAATGSVGGTVALSSPATAGNATFLANLNYKVFVDTSSGCTTTSVPSAAGAWIAGNATTYLSGLTTATPNVSRTLPAATAGAPGAPVFYCLIVQLGSTAPSSVQAATASATWTVTGGTPS
jgi:hypothetical protein